mgnify:CR=1 FL=1
MAREKSPDYGVLQEFIDRLFDGREDYMRLEVVLEGGRTGLTASSWKFLTFCLLVFIPEIVFAARSIHRSLLTDGVMYTARFIRHSPRG